MKRQHGRIKIEKQQVKHFKQVTHSVGFRHLCMFGCKNNARHIVKLGSASKVYCCTPHFAQVFEIPATRHPKAPKAKAVRPTTEPTKEWALKNWVLKRTLDFPLHFFGERLSCYHDGSVPGMDIFFSTYKTMATTESPRQYLSLAVLTKIAGKTRPLNFVCEYTNVHIYTAINEVISQYTMALDLEGGVLEKTTLVLKSIGSKFMAFLDEQVRK